MQQLQTQHTQFLKTNSHFSTGSIASKFTMTTQHYRVTLDSAVIHYQEGDLTAKGALRLWIRIRLAEGWECSIKPKEIRQAFSKNGKPMARSTFWHAIHQLAEEKEIELDQPENLVIKRLSKNLDTIQNSEPPSQILNDPPKNGTTIQNSEPPFQIPNEQEPKTLPNKGSLTSPNSYQSSYQIFINSLSPTERESFEDFCRREVASLPRPIVSLGDYLAASDASGQPRYEDFYRRFQNTSTGREMRLGVICRPHASRTQTN